MKSNFRERSLSSIRKFCRKHRRLYVPCLVAAFFCVLGYQIAQLITKNSSKLICTASILLFFAASSSFAYPVLTLNTSFVSDEDAGLQTVQAAETSDEHGDNASQEIVQDVAVASNATLAGLDKTQPVGDRTRDQKEADSEIGQTIHPDDTYQIFDLLEEHEEENMEDSTPEGEIPEQDADLQQSTGNTEPTADSVQFQADDWKLILINKQHSIPEGYDPPLSKIRGTNMACDKRVVDSLLEMFQAAEADGISLVICSPYRNSARQENLFARKIDSYLTSGSSYMEAYTLASQAVTVPGSSEHQAGLAIDIISNHYYQLDEGFGDTPAGQWLRDNAHRFGFILRYPKGKEEITGIEFEPWHFRYVGKEAATVIRKEGICLEEFWEEYL